MGNCQPTTNTGNSLEQRLPFFEQKGYRQITIANRVRVIRACILISRWWLEAKGRPQKQVVSDPIYRDSEECDATEDEWVESRRHRNSIFTTQDEEDLKSQKDGSWGRVEAVLKKLGPFVYDHDDVQEASLLMLKINYKQGVYKGEYSYHTRQRQGRGCFIWTDNSRYDGYWRNDKADGRGRLISANGDHYEGSWVQGVQEGYGVLTTAQSTYRGNWKNNLQHGKGTEEWSDGTKFDGDYKEGKKTGRGTYRWANGDFYAGQLNHGVLQGEGLFKWADGRQYQGQWNDQKMWGKGTFDWPCGKSYRGHYENDMKEGYGLFEWADGRKYIGQWSAGLQDGAGVYVSRNGKRREGEWEHGKLLHWVKTVEIDYEEEEEVSEDDSDAERSGQLRDERESHVYSESQEGAQDKYEHWNELDANSVSGSDF